MGDEEYDDKGIREQVAEGIAHGHNDLEILESLVERYFHKTPQFLVGAIRSLLTEREDPCDKRTEYEPGSKFMRVEDAIQIVLGLARENILEDRQVLDDDMEEDQEKQRVACDVIDDFFTNVMAEDRLVDLKEVLMKMGNDLVIHHRFSPEVDSVPSSLDKKTSLIAMFTQFVNYHEEAREVLKNLGFDWSMSDGTRGEEGDHLQGT